MNYLELIEKLIDLKNSGKAIDRFEVVFDDGSNIITVDRVHIGEDQIVLS